jgi:hypothetical protein
MKLKTRPDPYPISHRVKPFFKGIIDASPLVEIALEGLSRDLPQERRKEYIGKIARSGSTRHIFRAFLGGLSVKEQDALGDAYEAKYQAAKNQYDQDVYGSESALGAPMTWQLKKRYIMDTVTDAFILLRDGYVVSEKAQLSLAGIIYADGLVEHAQELVGNRALNVFAVQILRFKCHGEEREA